MLSMSVAVLCVTLVGLVIHGASSWLIKISNNADVLVWLPALNSQSSDQFQ